MKSIAFVLAGVLVLGACEAITGPDEDFSVHVDDGDLVLTNRLAESVRYYAVSDPPLAMVCYPTVYRVAAGEQEGLPYAAIIWYEPGTDRARVVWSTESYADHGSFAINL